MENLVGTDIDGHMSDAFAGAVREEDEISFAQLAAGYLFALGRLLGRGARQRDAVILEYVLSKGRAIKLGCISAC